MSTPGTTSERGCPSTYPCYKQQLPGKQHRDWSRLQERFSIVSAVVFAILVGSITALDFAQMHRAHALQVEMAAAFDSNQQIEHCLRAIPADINLGDLIARDVVRDSLKSRPGAHRQRLAGLRRSTEGCVRLLEQNAGSEAGPAVTRLRAELEGYWGSLDALIEGPPSRTRIGGRAAGSPTAAVNWKTVTVLIDEVATLNAAQIGRQQQERLNSNQQYFEGFLQKGLMALLLALVVLAFVSTHCFAVLEKRSRLQRRTIEHHRQELMQLSRNLMQAQEEERRLISRELHDSMGQLLTAAGIELSSLGRLKASSGEFRDRLEDLQLLNAEALEFVRDMAMGLRPSMLDDLGLEAALEWQCRQFSRRIGIPVTVQFSGDSGELSEAVRTCIYRSVQEALTNCAKHADAGRIGVFVCAQPGSIRVMVEDDGVGVDLAERSGRGIGLLGIQERVDELQGRFSLRRLPQGGTVLTIEVPVLQGVAQ